MKTNEKQEEERMDQEVQVELILGLSVNAALSKSTIIKRLNKFLKTEIDNDISVETSKVKKVKEEAEIYNNE